MTRHPHGRGTPRGFSCWWFAYHITCDLVPILLLSLLILSSAPPLSLVLPPQALDHPLKSHLFSLQGRGKANTTHTHVPLQHFLERQHESRGLYSMEVHLSLSLCHIHTNTHTHVFGLCLLVSLTHTFCPQWICWAARSPLIQLKWKSF